MIHINCSKIGKAVEMVEVLVIMLIFDIYFIFNLDHLASNKLGKPILLMNPWIDPTHNY